MSPSPPHEIVSPDRGYCETINYGNDGTTGRQQSSGEVRHQVDQVRRADCRYCGGGNGADPLRFDAHRRPAVGSRRRRGGAVHRSRSVRQRLVRRDPAKAGPVAARRARPRLGLLALDETVARAALSAVSAASRRNCRRLAVLISPSPPAGRPPVGGIPPGGPAVTPLSMSPITPARCAWGSGGRGVGLSLIHISEP